MKGVLDMEHFQMESARDRTYLGKYCQYKGEMDRQTDRKTDRHSSITNVKRGRMPVQREDRSMVQLLMQTQ